MYTSLAEPIHIVAAARAFGEEFIGLNTSFHLSQFHPILGIETKQDILHV